MRSTGPFLARGAAVFFAGLALLAVVAELRGRTADLSLWWVDLRDLAAPARMGFLLLVAAPLTTWALRRAPGRWLRRSAALVSLAVAALALRDTVVFAQAVGDGQVRPAVVVPLSAVTGLLFAVLGVHVLRATGPRARTLGRSGLVLAWAVCAWAVAFPVAQILWFGTTDYRRPAAAAVVFGARVYASGQPSPLLADRLRTGIELYRSGLASLLVMSGGDGIDGFNEARVMADVAISAGVPADAILVDPGGTTTEATVQHSTALLQGAGVSSDARVIAVSQAYHLPRIQLAYSNAGIDVLTVPAPEAQPIPELPLYVAREVPAFWSYLLRVCLG